MDNKKITKRVKVKVGSKSIRVSKDTFESGDRWVKLANEKKVGSKIKLDQVLSLALGVLTEEHIKKLQADSLKGSDRQEIMRQKYIKKFGHISKEDYLTFTTQPEYAEFLTNQNKVLEFETAV